MDSPKTPIMISQPTPTLAAFRALNPFKSSSTDRNTVRIKYRRYRLHRGVQPIPDHPNGCAALMSDAWRVPPAITWSNIHSLPTTTGKFALNQIPVNARCSHIGIDGKGACKTGLCYIEHVTLQHPDVEAEERKWMGRKGWAKCFRVCGWQGEEKGGSVVVEEGRWLVCVEGMRDGEGMYMGDRGI